MPERVLDGVRVIDFGRHVAGPYVAALLGDLGADVIRVERRRGSEDRFQAPLSDDGSGATFLQMNRNKRGIVLDPLAPDGREVTRRLVASADVVVANLPQQTLRKMGLDYETLRQVKADIILTTISAFGSGGPYSDRVGFDGIGQVMCGAAYLSGEPGHPTKSYVPWVDFCTGALAATGTLAALFWRDRSGEGQHVEGSLLHSALAVAGTALAEQAVIRADRVATLNRAQVAGPADIFRTTDGWVLVQVVGQSMFERWVKLVASEEFLDDPRFGDDDARGRNGEVLSECMAAWCATRSTVDALSDLEDARVPGAPVFSPQAALDDPHVRAVGFLQEVQYPGLPRAAPLVRTPFSLLATPTSIRRRPPTLGEHTAEVLSELGYSRAELIALEAQGVV